MPEGRRKEERMEVKTFIQKGIERIRKFGLKEWGLFLVVGICILMIAMPLENSEKEKKETLAAGQTTDNTEQGTNTESQDYVKILEKRLEELLHQVENIGEVSVMITVKSSMEKVVLKDQPQETESSLEQDSQGGSRSTISSATEESTILVESGNGTVPYIMKEIYPQVEGVVVIAQGSQTGTVDLDILAAVQVLFDVPAHKIKIMKMKK